MQELLKGRWQAESFTIHGVETKYEEGKGPLFKIHEDRKVGHAYHYNGTWSTTGNLHLKEDADKPCIYDGNRLAYTIKSVSQHNMEIVVATTNTEIMVYKLKRVTKEI